MRQIAQLNRTAVKERYNQIHQEVIFLVENAFYETACEKGVKAVAALALKNARTNLDQVQALRAAGRSSQYDFLRAGVQVSEAIADSIRTLIMRLSWRRWNLKML